MPKEQELFSECKIFPAKSLNFYPMTSFQIYLPSSHNNKKNVVMKKHMTKFLNEINTSDETLRISVEKTKWNRLKIYGIKSKESLKDWSLPLSLGVDREAKIIHSLVWNCQIG